VGALRELDLLAQPATEVHLLEQVLSRHAIETLCGAFDYAEPGTVDHGPPLIASHFKRLRLGITARLAAALLVLRFAA
jgi:hypothetical protein